jgi:ADP-ribose pyrophosphatase YjhB (NUDIX family)
VDVAHFCVNCGAPLVAREIEGRMHEACPNDDFVLWHDPKVVTAVVVEAPGGVLLGRRAIEPGLGLWCLPGGFVNDDEGPLDAAVRECREEIGAAVEVMGLVGVYHIAKTNAPSMVGVGYRARLAEGERPRPGSEMLELAVFALDSLPPLAFPSHGQILGDYLTSRALPAEVGSPTGGAAVRRASRPSRTRARSPRSHTQ